MKTERKLSAFLVLEVAVPLLLLTLVTAWLAGSGADVTLERWSYSATRGWPLGDLPPWNWFYKVGPWPAVALSAGSALILLGSIVVKPWRRTWRVTLFFSLAMLVGPGLLVNGVLKNEWGRPRPRQLLEFGGTDTYRTPLLPDWAKPDRHSFPSGHASMGFFLLTPYFIYRRTQRTRAHGWLTAGISAGLLIGAARMMQGGHFFTDVLWAGGVVYGTGAVIAFFLEPQLPVAEHAVDGPASALSDAAVKIS